MHRSLILAALVTVLVSPAPARAAEDRMTELERKLDAAIAEIERLKLGSAASDTAPSYAGRHGLAPGAARVYGVSGGTSVGGYGEVLLERADRKREDGTLSGATPRADMLRAVFYVGHKFTPALLFNSELEFEHAGVRDEAEVAVDPATGEGAAELTGEVVVEFAYLDWQVRPTLGLRAGKLLVPMGLVNEQHEPPVFVGARRPDTERFVIPSTWSAAGAGLYGETAAGLEWRAYVVEGLDARKLGAVTGLREARQGASRALVTHPAFVGRVDWTGPEGLVVGASGYTGDAWQSAPPAAGAVSARVSVADLHARWQWRGLELRGLWAFGSIGDAGEVSDALGLTGADRLGERFAGGYAEAMLDLAPRLSPGASWTLAPYARFETLDTQDSVAGGSENPRAERRIVTLGVAAKPHPNVVLKTDREWRHDEAERETGRWNVALGWLF